MKRLIFILISLLCFSFAKAEITFYKADSFAYKYVNAYGNWTDWTRWQYSDILISIDSNRDIITIYSEMEQKYRIIEWNGRYRDNKGGEQTEFIVVDQDGDKGIIRIRIQSNGVAQLYVEFDNVMWVYSGLVQT